MSLESAGLGQEEDRAMKSFEVLTELPVDPLAATQTDAGRLAPEQHDGGTEVAARSLSTTIVGVEEDRPMTSIDVSGGFPVDALAAIRTEARQRLAQELLDVRTTLVASYGEAMARLDNDRWVPSDLVARLVNEISAAAAAERERGDALAKALELAQAEVQSIRTESQATIIAARETAARFERELNASRDEAQSAAAAEAHVRTELAAVRTRYQDILDSQMLQLVEFKREIEHAEKSDPARTAATATVPITSTRPGRPETTRPTVNVRGQQDRNGGAPAFDAIEAALAASPPLGRWPRVVG